jgi:hypothetical protein
MVIQTTHRRSLSQQRLTDIEIFSEAMLPRSGRKR